MGKILIFSILQHKKCLCVLRKVQNEIATFQLAFFRKNLKLYFNKRPLINNYSQQYNNNNCDINVNFAKKLIKL
ncbi:MAG TPA: hypothetical protein DCM62_08230 [Bacteroidales bacterium]|nr:hypothetical protein [Bacteroidales bacterium]